MSKNYKQWNSFFGMQTLRWLEYRHVRFFGKFWCVEVIVLYSPVDASIYHALHHLRRRFLQNPFSKKWKNFVGRTKIPAVRILSYNTYDNNGYKLCAYKKSWLCLYFKFLTSLYVFLDLFSRLESIAHSIRGQSKTKYC